MTNFDRLLQYHERLRAYIERESGQALDRALLFRTGPHSAYRAANLREDQILTWFQARCATGRALARSRMLQSGRTV